MSVKINIQGEDLTYTQETDRAMAIEVIRFLLSPKKGLGGSKTDGKRVKRPSKSSSKEITEGIADLKISVVLEGYPKYHDLKYTREKILWLLAFAKKQSVESLAPVDIEFLAKKFDDKILTKDFKAFNQTNIKMGFIAEEQGRFRILKDGLDSLTRTAKD